MLPSLALFLLGLALVVVFAEKLVEGAVGTSLGFGVSAFLVSVVFIGFDPENLAVGAVASAEGVAGIALGSVIGSAMVAVALAFGITAVLVPMRFERVPRRVLAVPVAAAAWMALLSADGLLSRMDGGLLLAGFLLSLLYLFRLGRRGLDIRATGEVAEVLEKPEMPGRWKAFGLLLVSLAAIVAGSELVIRGSEGIMAWLGLTDTVFGMTVLAFLMSIEELARELPAALEGRPDITLGNVVGSVLAFFLFNAGVIALVEPVPVGPDVLRFHLPFCAGTVVFLALVLTTRSMPRWAGGVLVLLYVAFVGGSYLLP